MSGPKGGGYTVETAEAREAREYAAALASYEQTRLAVSRLRVEALAARSALGSSIPVLAELAAGRTIGRSSSDVLAADRAARVLLGDAEEQLHSAARALGRERWMQRSLQVTPDDRKFASAAEQVGRTSVVRVPDTEWCSKGIAQLAEIAGGWPTDAATTVLDDATAEVRAARGPSGVALGVSRARDELRRLRDAQRAKDARQEEEARLRAEIESVRQWQDPNTVDEIIRAIDTGTADAAARVASFVAEGHARRDRDEASGILADVLVEMGYRLGEGFATRLSGPTDVLVGHPDWTQHAVSVRLDDAGRIFTHVVRAVDAADDADDRIDTEFCTDFDAIASRAELRGLVLNSVRRFRPGERALRAVDSERVREVAAVGRHAPAKTRER